TDIHVTLPRAFTVARFWAVFSMYLARIFGLAVVLPPQTSGGLDTPTQTLLGQLNRWTRWGALVSTWNVCQCACLTTSKTFRAWSCGTQPPQKSLMLSMKILAGFLTVRGSRSRFGWK